MIADAVSASEPDWSREARRGFWDPSRALLASIRSYQRHAGRGGPIHGLARGIAVLRHRFWSAMSGADIPPNTRIGGGLLLPHPNGVVIHCDAVIGPNCLLFQQVTIGVTSGGAPTLGGGVDVGTGAKVLGGVTLGDHCRIGANAVVTRDVPAGAVAIGIPAKVVEQGR